MISFDEAYRIAIGRARVLGEETVALGDAAGRVLAQDVLADAPMPPYDKAMVDGYACRRADLGGTLRVVETIAAGHAPKNAIGPGECAKIMTGAMVPAGADCVFLVEQSRAGTDGAVRFTGRETDDNISPRGRDYRAGDALIVHGARIHPPEVAVMASVGCVRPRVYGRPRVAVLATGDELVEPDQTPDAWHIRNSNGPQVCAQASRMALAPEYIGIAKDNAASVDECLSRAASQSEVLLISGGVSMGDFDLVPGQLRERGFEILFDRVAIQPGKPTTFAVAEGKWCFGLPGNPVSSFVIFELLVKPFLYALMGHRYRPISVRMPAGDVFSRKSGARQAWVPVTIGGDGTLRRVGYRGSSHINALCGADGLIAFPEGVTEIAAGALLDVRLIRD
jgi:molybdopterin molybdotransferase